MSVGLLLECDELVARQFLEPRGQLYFKYDCAIGLIRDGKLVGTVLLHGWNGSNLELSYSGISTLSVGVMRALARYMLAKFNLARLTVITRKRNRRLVKSIQKLGFRLEGAQRCYYGRVDCNRNTGVRFVAFRDQVEKVAKLTKQPEVKQCL